MPLRRGRLADIQAQQVEVGRIRLGSSKPRPSGRGIEAVKLETFRLTSRSRDLIEEAAGLYGGECEAWEPHSGGAQQWQVFTERRSIAVVVPPDPVSQFYEAWAGGKCTRRCDGATELISNEPCLCGPDPSQRRCKPTTRLALMLLEMSGIGVWRLETHGYYAAAELPAVADLLSAVGGNVPARLEMEERQAMVPDPRKPGEQVPTRFMVPVLHVQRTPGQLVQILGGAAPTALPGAPQPQALPPAPQPSALTAAAAEQEYDPEQERIRQQWVIHTDFENRIAAAAGPDMVGIANAIRQSGLDEQFLASLRLKWGDRAKALSAAKAATEPEPERVPQPPPEAIGTSRGTVDRSAEIMSIQTTAARMGLTLSGIRARFAEFTNGAAMDEATGEQLAEFHRFLGSDE